METEQDKKLFKPGTRGFRLGRFVNTLEDTNDEMEFSKEINNVMIDWAKKELAECKND